MQLHRTDCLVIGAGLAGSAYALQMAKRGFAVELLSLGEPLAANSDWAQGGIIYDASGEAGSLAQDIMVASDHTANPAAIDQLVREGPLAVKEFLIDELGVGFDRQADGSLDFTREGGHGPCDPRVGGAAGRCHAWHPAANRLGRDRSSDAVPQLGRARRSL